MDRTDSPSAQHKELKQDPHHGVTITKVPNTKNKGLKDDAEENASHMQRKGCGHTGRHTGGRNLSTVFTILQENAF